jgi:DNA polymerase III alpha subunit
MIQNNVGEMIFDEQDVCDLLMSGREPASIKRMLVNESVNIEQAIRYVETYPDLIKYTGQEGVITNVFDKESQAKWHMPEEYKQLDIAEYVLGLCTTEAELQRVGHELLLYQERDLFNLLRYLKYLVDVMTENRVIWGVGRGSSVASYVLYKLGVHRIDSMFYKLEPEEFLR